MNVLGQYLDAREEGPREQREADERWLRERAGIDPAERLQSWDRWIRGVLSATLAWPSGADARARLLHQCAAEMTVLAKQLRGRGWLLDGKALAVHVSALLEPIGKAQRAGKVGDLWPYFRASVDRYVDANAERLQCEAKRTGADVGAQTIGAVLGGLSVLRSVEGSMTELLADRAAEIGRAREETCACDRPGFGRRNAPARPLHTSRSSFERGVAGRGKPSQNLCHFRGIALIISQT